MSGGPSTRALAGGAVLAVFLGLGVAYCEHHDDPVATYPCANTAFEVPAGPIEGTRAPAGRSSSTVRKNLDPPPSRVREVPPRVAVSPKAPARPAPSPSKSRTHGPRPHHEFDGC
ncbi:hypothetical protein [Streptomyces eurythermus]